MEHYGWCVGSLWVVCESIRERNYRLKKKNYLFGPIHGPPRTGLPGGPRQPGPFQSKLIAMRAERTGQVIAVHKFFWFSV